MVHHGLIDETEPSALAETQDDGFSFAEFAPVYRPEISLHVPGQPDFDDPVKALVGIRFERLEVAVGKNFCAGGRSGVVSDRIRHRLLTHITDAWHILSPLLRHRRYRNC